jgi:HPr kinase/phosphorylase
MEEPKQPNVTLLTVGELVSLAPASLELKVLAGEDGLKVRRITSDRLQKFGLALSSRAQNVSGRVQMIGGFETAFFEKLSESERADLLDTLDHEKMPCIVVTRGILPFDELTRFANRYSIPLLTTPLISSEASSLLTDYLQNRLAAEATFHGVLMGIDGVGVLITGESGIGKSECAFDLIARGHRLVSDDTVRVRRIGNRLIGSSPEITFAHLEIRGLGIVNVRELFGVSSVSDTMTIDLCIELRRWDDAGEIDRIGSQAVVENLLGLERQKFIFPVRPGRNLSNLAETAVKIYLARKGGHNAAARLVEKHYEHVSST